MSAAIAELVAGWAKPRTEPVEGAPFQPGDLVKVVEDTDGTIVGDWIGHEGEVAHLEYDCGCGQTFPGDPMIGVRFECGTVREFWKEELQGIPRAE